jgi:AsmA protein
MRKIAIFIGAIAAVAIVAAEVFALTFDINRYRQTIQSQMQKRLGRPVTLGQMHLKLFPLRFSANEIAIADDPNFSPDAPFLKAQYMDISVKLLPLLHKQIDVSSLTLKRPALTFIKNEAGTWNTASMGRPENAQDQSKKPSPAAPTNASQAPATSEAITLSELAIQDGQVSVLDRQKSKTPSLYDHIDITLKDYTPGTPFTVDAVAHMPGAGSEQVRLQGTGGPVVRGQPELTPFEGTLDFKQVAIADLAKFLNSAALQGAAGTLTGQTKINAKSGKLNAQGEADLQNGKVQGMELGYPIHAQYDLTHDLQAGLITLRNTTLKLGPTPFYVSGSVNTKPTPAQLDVNVRANNASIAELMKLAAASGVALSPGTNVTGNANLNVQARGAANKPALNGTITASNIEMSGREIAQPVHIQTVNLHLTPSQVSSDPFVVTSGGTALNTQFAVRDYTSPAPTLDATVRAPNAQLPAVLSLAKAYGVKGLDKVSGSGVMNLDMHAAGPVKSITSAEIIKALNGATNLNLNNVKYSGANMLQHLGSIGGFFNTASAAQSAPGITNISKVTGDIFIKNGIAQTNNLQAQLDVGNIGLVGTANLLDQTLNLRATAVLNQAFSQKVGGSSISGFMNTALANKQGQLVVPCQIAGTFSNPTFTPDVQQVAQMKLKGLMPDVNNPSSSVNSLFKLLGKPNAQPEGQPQNEEQKQNQQQQQKPNAAQQILEMLQKNKPQSQPTPPK